MTVRFGVALAGLVMLWGTAGAAQFAPAVRVNDSAITGYEIEQRATLLGALGAPGNLVEEATNRLIDEELQTQAATAAGLSVTAEEVADGVAEFAGRANTTADNFLATLAARGVGAESFRAFVEAGLLWRKYVRERLAPRIEVDEGDVEAALDAIGAEGGIRVLLSEIILPARNAEEAARAEALAPQLAAINGVEAFAAAARAYSGSATRERGGRLDWIDIATLPGPLRDQVLTLSPGEVAAPLRGQGVVAVFQLRSLEEAPRRAPDIAVIDYAQYLAADAAEARAVAQQIDTCDDLYGVARGLPAERLIRETQAPAQIPSDIRSELDRLDRDEVSLRLSRAGRPAVTMLCARRTQAAAETDVQELRNRLANRRIAAAADSALAALRADAVLVGVE